MKPITIELQPHEVLLIAQNLTDTRVECVMGEKFNAVQERFELLAELQYGDGWLEVEED